MQCMFQETVSKYESNCESLKKTHAEKVDELMQKICEMDDRMLEMKQKLQVPTISNQVSDTATHVYK